MMRGCCIPWALRTPRSVLAARRPTDVGHGRQAILARRRRRSALALLLGSAALGAASLPAEAHLLGQFDCKTATARAELVVIGRPTAKTSDTTERTVFPHWFEQEAMNGPQTP